MYAQFRLTILFYPDVYSYQVKPSSMPREYRLPNLYPLLLSIRQPSLRFAERACENLPDASTQDLQRQHGLPIAHCEPDPICINGDNPGIHLDR